MPIIKKKWEDMTPEEKAITAQEERRGYAGIVKAAESKSPEQPKPSKPSENPKIFPGGAPPEPNSTVLVGTKAGAKAISAEEYKKQQKKPEKPNKRKRFLRALARMIGR